MICRSWCGFPFSQPIKQFGRGEQALSLFPGSTKALPYMLAYTLIMYSDIFIWETICLITVTLILLSSLISFTTLLLFRGGNWALLGSSMIRPVFQTCRALSMARAPRHWPRLGPLARHVGHMLCLCLAVPTCFFVIFLKMIILINKLVY